MSTMHRLSLLLLIPLLWLLLAAAALAQTRPCPPDASGLSESTITEGCVQKPDKPSFGSNDIASIPLAGSTGANAGEPCPPQDPATWRPDPGAVMTVKKPVMTNVNGHWVPVQPMDSLKTGVLIPDGQGGYILSNEKSAPTPNPNHEAALEVKLKVRELAEQLLGGSGYSVGGLVAVPSSFVHQDNFQVTSSLGRYLSEQLMHEFVKRGVRVREYRMGAAIDSRPGGDFFLAREQDLPRAGKGVLVIAGTYYWDRENVFVNARLVRGDDGEVLRTGNLVFGQTLVTKKMLASTNAGAMLQEAKLGIRDFQEATKAPGLTAIDKGYDVR